MPTVLKLAVVTSMMLAAVVACGRKDGASGGAAGSGAGETSTTSASLSGGGTAKAKASCDMLAVLGTCNEYRQGTSFGLEKSLCDGFKGKFSNTGCSTAGQLGWCTMSDGEVKRYYGETIAGDHALTAAEAKSDCESDLVRGSFTAAPTS